MKTILIPSALCLLLAGCLGGSSDIVQVAPGSLDQAEQIAPQAEIKPAPAVLLTETAVVEPDAEVISEYEHYYIVFADTAFNYHALRKQMYVLKDKLEIEIDTMGRGYDPLKNLICLPLTDPDDSWAGEYYPRRFPSASLSLEYLDLYMKGANGKTIALVAGIYEQEHQADSALLRLKPFSPNAFRTYSELFVGCMH